MISFCSAPVPWPIQVQGPGSFLLEPSGWKMSDHPTAWALFVFELTWVTKLVVKKKLISLASRPACETEICKKQNKMKTQCMVYPQLVNPKKIEDSRFQSQCLIDPLSKTYLKHISCLSWRYWIETEHISDLGWLIWFRFKGLCF